VPPTLERRWRLGKRRAGRSIQERYGIAKDEADKQVSEWVRKADDSWFGKDKSST
jgi:hypothetical protein